MRATDLFNPTTASPLQIYMPSIQAAATSFAVEVSAAPVHAKDEIEGVIAAQARNPGGSLIVMPDIFTGGSRPDYCVGGPLRRAGDLLQSLFGDQVVDRL